MKAELGRAALAYVTPGQVIGVGTGSTVNHFIAALAWAKTPVAGAVATSRTTAERLQAAGIAVLDANQVDELPVYMDGADEIDPQGRMIKGGGGALTQEKIVAAQSRCFVCLADESKSVAVLGRFPLPVEVIPQATRQIQARFAELAKLTKGWGQQGAVVAKLRLQPSPVPTNKGHESTHPSPWVTENAGHILDVSGLCIEDPWAMEREIKQWPGVVSVGIFAEQRAHVCLLGTQNGVQILEFGGP